MPEEIRQLLIQQVCSPVKWEESMRLMLSQGVDQFYEVGPGRVPEPEAVNGVDISRTIVGE